MKILLTADPELPVPPGLYGGIERIVDMLISAYVAEGHEVTLCAHPASQVPCKLVPWKGASSRSKVDLIRNMATLTREAYIGHYDVLHSFSRLAYMTFLLPARLPKIMSYQREPSLQQVRKAVRLAREGSLVFTGCSGYISNKIAPLAEAYPIYNGAPLDRYQPTQTVEANAPLFFLGRIEPIKGTHHAVRAAQIAQRKLIIAGNIPSTYQSYFDELIKPHLNEQIQYIGPVDDAQKNHWLGQSAALLMPIDWNEPFGIVMAEAMACGTPVIGFPRGSVNEVVVHGVNGFHANTAEEMAWWIQRLPEIQRSEVRRYAELHFSDTKIVQDYLQLYQRLINRAMK